MSADVYCERCGALAPPGSAVCHHCGAAVGSSMFAAPAVHQPSVRNGGVTAVIVVVAIALYGLAVGLAAQRSDSSDSGFGSGFEEPAFDDGFDSAGDSGFDSGFETSVDTTPPFGQPATVDTFPVATEPPPTAPPIDTTTVPPLVGDLELGYATMSRPFCDGSYITALASAVNPDRYTDEVARGLRDYPGAQYLRTDQACPSLRPDLDGNPIYMVYFGPYPSLDQACAARSAGPQDAYVRVLSTTADWREQVQCP